MKNIISAEIVENRIFFIRKQKVMLDMHLAELYGVSTKVLNQAVKRNRSRFPVDFMFQLDKNETQTSRSQFVTLKFGDKMWSQNVTTSQKYRRSKLLPYAFTEQGVAMLSSVLKSDRAVQVNILIMRTFVKIRELMATHVDLAQKIGELEQKYAEHNRKIGAILKVIKALLEPPLESIEPEPEKPPMGFHMPEKKPTKQK